MNILQILFIIIGGLAAGFVFLFVLLRKIQSEHQETYRGLVNYLNYLAQFDDTVDRTLREYNLRYQQQSQQPQQRQPQQGQERQQQQQDYRGQGGQQR